MVVTVITRELGLHRRSIIGWTLGVMAIVTIQLVVYPTVRSSAGDWSRVIDEFPEALREILRLRDYTSEVGYLSAELLSFVLPFVMMGYGARWGSRVATQDEEMGLADLVLTLPIARSRYVASRSLAAMLALLVPVAGFLLTLILGSRLLSFTIPLSRYAAAAAVLYELGLVTTLIGVFVGGLTGRRSMALGVAMSIAIALFIVYSLAPLVPVFESTLGWNPLQWTIGADPLSNGLARSNLAWLVSTYAVLGTGSVLAFQRRDVGV